MEISINFLCTVTFYLCYRRLYIIAQRQYFFNFRFRAERFLYICKSLLSFFLTIVQRLQPETVKSF